MSAKKISRRPLLLFSGMASIFLLVGFATAFWTYHQGHVPWQLLYVHDVGSLKKTVAELPPPSAQPNELVVHIPILMYHYIEHVQDPKDTFRQKLSVYPEVLDNQIKTLQDNGYTFLSMTDVSNILDGKKELPQKPIVLTFDDGYRDFYTDAFPILEKYHAKATAYIISGFIGKPNYMLSTQLSTISQSSEVEIGAHTQHHIDLNLASPKQQTTEILGSKKDLETKLKIPITTFAYPSGRYNDQTIKIVAESGFATAVTTHPGTLANPSKRLVLDRLRPGSRTNKSLLDFLREKTS
jgi:peptidoglycan/xylan/chitin deacetylase (PgdA/CDA1 family)